MQKSKFGHNSFLNVNDRFLEEYITNLQESSDKHNYDVCSSNFDQQLYSYYAAQNYLINPISKQLYQMPVNNSVKLDVPKNNSLTDSMLRTTLGCQENLAKSYLQIIDRTEQIEHQEKQKRIEEAKNKFALSNHHRDMLANSKAFASNTKYYVDRPVIDNQHEAFMKTQLTFMNPINSARTSKDFTDKYSGIIAKKISEIGGIQDTIAPMESTLSTHELTLIKKRQILSSNEIRKSSKSPIKNSSCFLKSQEPEWLSKSKQMRQKLASTFR